MNTRKKQSRDAKGAEKVGGNPMTNSRRALTARRDTVDFRDLMYVPTLIEVPAERPLQDYLETNPIILDQGQEGACTGFGLAAVANHLLRTRKTFPDPGPVSARMLYEMAKRHDEWPGENYDGSSARGAMKGWHKFGVCGQEAWPYVFNKPDSDATAKRLQDARRRPLGAYFRVNHKDLVAMHAALAETGVLFATCKVHGGWDDVGNNGRIKFQPDVLGGHAFALVAYNTKGFWLQNSWGENWGKSGFAHLSYDDWLENGTDVWVARLGAPVELDSAQAFSASTFTGARMGQGASFADLRPHIISLSNNGQPSTTGDFANTPTEIRSYVHSDFREITRSWRKKRILLYAHGGLVGEDVAVQRVAEYRSAMLTAQVYPLAFAWHSDFWSTIKNILGDALGQRRSEGMLDKAKDFMLDRLDDTLEPIARALTGKAQWSEMKENAIAATEARGGGAAIVLNALKDLVQDDSSIEIHVAAHSAGSVFMGPVVRELARFTTIQTCQLWAPACTLEFFRDHYLPHLEGSRAAIREFALYTLSDEAEQDDHCARIYNKSLLYLVSRALEDEYRPFSWGWQGAPLLGMERFVKVDPDLLRIFKRNSSAWILAPNHDPDPLGSAGSTHGGFDDDPATVRGTLKRILGPGASLRSLPEFARSFASCSDRRKQLQAATR